MTHYSVNAVQWLTSIMQGGLKLRPLLLIAQILKSIHLFVRLFGFLVVTTNKQLDK